MFLFHAQISAYKEVGFIDPSTPLGKVVVFVGQHGATGVDFFFILSGFVLAWAWRRGDRPLAFYRRRFARIAPAYWVALVYGTVWAMIWAAQPLVALKRTLPSWLGIQAWFPRQEIFFAGNGVGWTLSVELFFYAAFPLLIALTLRRHGRWVLAGVAVLLAMVIPEAIYRLPGSALLAWLVNIFPGVRVGEFALGVLAAVVMRGGVRCRVDHRVAAVLFLSLYFARPLLPAWFPLRTISVLLMLLVICSLAQRDADGRATLLNRALPVKLGEWSYCFYLVHQVTLGVVSVIVPRGINTLLLGPLFLGGSLIASLLLAAALHYLVELPAERRLRGTRSNVTQATDRHASTVAASRREVPDLVKS